MYTLFIWTVVAMARGIGTESDWRPMAQFESQQLCMAGARLLVIKDDRYRCVKTK